METDSTLPVVLAYSPHDQAQAHAWLNWSAELGGTTKHDLFIMPSKGIHLALQIEGVPAAFMSAWKSVTVLRDDEGVVSDWHKDDPIRDASGPNSSIRQVAWYFYLNGQKPWLWIEPDAIPLRPDWLDRIEAEYRTCGHKYMGSLVQSRNSVPAHSTGNMVWPGDAAVACPHLMLRQSTVINGRELEIAFDVAAAVDVMRDFHDTKLIQQIFRTDIFRTAEDLGLISPEAVLFHTGGGGNGSAPRLLERLREKYFGQVSLGKPLADSENGLKSCCPEAAGAPKGTSPDQPISAKPEAGTAGGEVPGGKSPEGVVVSPHAVATPAVSSRVPNRVYTFVRWINLPKMKAEQEKLLALWKQSWSAHGWEPVVLTRADAEKHPKFAEWYAAFDKLPIKNSKVYELEACLTRWCAWAAQDDPLLTFSDYDTMSATFTPFMAQFAYAGAMRLYCGHVPCVGTIQPEFIPAWINRFIEGNAESDMEYLDRVKQSALYHTGTECREFGTPGWREARLIHFSHAACGDRKRSEVIEEWRKDRGAPVQMPSIFTPEPINGTETASAASGVTMTFTERQQPRTIADQMREHIGHLKHLCGTTPSRLMTLKNELRSAGLIGSARRKKRVDPMEKLAGGKAALRRMMKETKGK